MYCTHQTGCFVTVGHRGIIEGARRVGRCDQTPVKIENVSLPVRKHDCFPEALLLNFMNVQKQNAEIWKGNKKNN